MSNKLGLIGSWWRICSSGFGLGVDAARAFGIVIFIVSLVFVVGIALLWWIISFFMKRNKEKKGQEAPDGQTTQTPKQE